MSGLDRDGHSILAIVKVRRARVLDLGRSNGHHFGLRKELDEFQALAWDPRYIRWAEVDEGFVRFRLMEGV